MNTSTEPPREAVLELLNHEIEHARDEEQRSGWTLWALAGALAGALLLLLDLWERGGFSLVASLKWLVILGLLADSVIGWIWTWAEDQHFRTSRRYRSLRDYEHQKLAFGWRAIYSLLFALVAWHVGGSVWDPAVVYTVGFYGLLSLISLASIWISSVEWPYPAPKPPSLLISLAIVLLFSLCTAVSVISYGRTLMLPSPGSSTVELRIAALAVVANLIVFRLLLGLRRPPSIRKLVRLRRELALGKIETQAAARGAELTLLGMEGHNALEEYLIGTLAIHEEFWEADVRVQEESQSVHDALAHLSTAGDGSRDAERTLEEIREGLDSIDHHLRKCEKLEQRITKRMRRHDLLAWHIRREAPLEFARGAKPLHAIFEHVEEQNARVRARMEEMRSMRRAMAQRFDDLSAGIHS